ncbi:MAG: MerR family transcriptional regulator [Oscillospiraceae bacterium]|nr:MerR family transcriptional regulator [Oscillospiraceae bacterium]
MRKNYKIGEVANILGISADTIRYYEKMGILYSKKDGANGYRFFTPADIYALLDVLFYRGMDIPVEEVRNIMNSYQHQDVKKLLEGKEKQVQAKIREQQALLDRIRATIEDYRIMDESLDVFQVRAMPSMMLFNESPADSQAYFNSMMEQEGQNPVQTVGSLIESGFIAARGGAGWEMTRMFTAALLQKDGASNPPESGRMVNVPKAVYTVVRSPWGIPMEEMLAPALGYAAQQGLKVQNEVFGLWVFTDYSQPRPLDYVALYLPVE